MILLLGLKLAPLVAEWQAQQEQERQLFVATKPRSYPAGGQVPVLPSLGSITLSSDSDVPASGSGSSSESSSTEDEAEPAPASSTRLRPRPANQPRVAPAIVSHEDTTDSESEDVDSNTTVPSSTEDGESEYEDDVGADAESLGSKTPAKGEHDSRYLPRHLPRSSG